MILAKSPETAWRVIEGEAMILSLDNKVFRGLNSVGSRVWELIDGRRSVDEIVSQIVGEFDVLATLRFPGKEFFEDLLAALQVLVG